MDVIVSTKKNQFKLETCFDAENKEFVTVYYIDEKKTILEKFTKIEEVIATHDFWCKITGLVNKPFKRNELPPEFQHIKVS